MEESPNIPRPRDPGIGTEQHSSVPPSRRRRRQFPLNFSVVVPTYGDFLSEGQVRMIIDLWCRGGVVWFKSDCGYAATVDPRQPAAVAVLDVLLDHAGQPIPVTVADTPLAATLIPFDRTARGSAIRDLTGRFWPGQVGIHAEPMSRFARKLGKNLHAPAGLVVRLSASNFEQQLSATARLPIPSAALRVGDRLVTDYWEALELTVRLHEERAPDVPTILIKDPRQAPRATGHSTMVSVAKDGTHTTLRQGSVEVADPFRAQLSRAGVDWSDAT